MPGTYVGLNLTRGDSVYLTGVLRIFLRDEDQSTYPHLEIQSDPHCTAIYSKESIPYHSQEGVYFATITGCEWWSGHDARGYVVAVLDSPGIVAFNKELVSLGGVNSFPTYRPHLTLMIGGGCADEAVGKQWASAVGKLLKGEEVTFSGETVRALEL